MMAYHTQTVIKSIFIFLKNSTGLEANITSYGGAVVLLKVPNKNGELADTVLGYDNPND